MGNGYFEKMNMRNIDKRSRSATASMRRRGRNGGGIGGEKPKPPQRGLGVAQLEKIRLHGQMGCCAPYCRPFFPNLSLGDDMRMQTPSSSFSHFTTQSSSSPSSGFHQNFMGMEKYERGSFRYEDSQPTTSMRWEPSNSFLETTQHFGQQYMIGHLINPHVQDSMHKNMNTKYGRNSIGSNSCENYESSDTQELDLELRLSI